MRLAPNFTLGEFAVSTSFPDLVEPVPDKYIPAVQALAERLQFVRDKVGPVKILSCYRPAALNKAVGGSRTSQHAVAEAVDFTCADFPLALAAILSVEMPALGQVIYYPEQQFVHMALPSKKYPTLTVCYHKPPAFRYRQVPLASVRSFFKDRGVDIPATDEL